jgi:tRNA(adenine34) deaminase
MEKDQFFIDEAYKEAQNALGNNEVPIGAVIIRDGAVVGRGFNQIELLSDPTAHAEIIAIRDAARNTGSWKWLCECSLYVTVEPCLMCLGSIFQSRISRVIFGAANPRFGAATKDCYIQKAQDTYGIKPLIEHYPDDKCGKILQDFFKSVRISAKNSKI